MWVWVWVSTLRWGFGNAPPPTPPRDKSKDETLVLGVLTTMTDTPAVVLLCLAAVLKCVCSLPVTSIFMLSPKVSSYMQEIKKIPIWDLSSGNHKRANGDVGQRADRYRDPGV